MSRRIAIACAVVLLAASSSFAQERLVVAPGTEVRVWTAASDLPQRGKVLRLDETTVTFAGHAEPEVTVERSRITRLDVGVRGSRLRQAAKGALIGGAILGGLGLVVNECLLGGFFGLELSLAGLTLGTPAGLVSGTLIQPPLRWQTASLTKRPAGPSRGLTASYTFRF